MRKVKNTLYIPRSNGGLLPDLKDEIEMEEAPLVRASSLQYKGLLPTSIADERVYRQQYRRMRFVLEKNTIRNRDERVSP